MARSASGARNGKICLVRILLVSQMYPGPDDPDLGAFVRQMELALRERGHDIDLAVLDRRSGGKRRYLELARRVRHAAEDADALTSLERTAERAVADEGEAAAPELRERISEPDDVLSNGEAADAKESRMLQVARRRLLAEALEIDPHVDHVGLAARGGELRLELAAQVVRDHDYC